LARASRALEDAPLEQDLQQHRRADQAEQAGHLTRIHREAQLVDRRAEAARFAGDAHVAAAGDLQPATHAGALDHRHRGHRAGAHRIQGCGHQILVVVQRVIHRSPHGEELLDVATGGEGLVARTPQHHAAHVRVGVDRAHACPQPPPHAGIHGVEFVGIGQGEGGDACVLTEEDFSGHGGRFP
jgi:hypothetical protein